MMSWVTTSWSDVCTLHYGKALKNYKHFDSAYPVYGSGGIVGSTDTPIAPAKRPIVARKGTLTVYWSEDASHIIDTAYWLEPKETLDPHWAYFAVLALGVAHLLWQAMKVDTDNAKDCLVKFKTNRDFGFIILAAIIAGHSAG